MTTTHPGMPSVLDARGIHFSYGAIAALKGVDLDVRAGEVVCVIGPNGAGKSTLARVVGGLTPPAQGQVLLDGKPLPKRSHLAVSSGVASVL